VYAAEDVVFYILRSSGGVHGLRKLVLLTFLADYERVGGAVVKYLYGGRPLSGAKFYVWPHSVMSNEVWRAAEGDAVKARVDQLGRVVLYTDAEPRLPPEVAARLREVLAKYGGLRGGQLERLALKLLRLNPEDLADYAGVWVDDYLRESGVMLKLVDLVGALHATKTSLQT